MFDNLLAVLFFLLVVGFLVLFAETMGPTERNKPHETKEACEKSLPRDQQCVIQYVPQSK